jgi:hypothetical protein
MYRPSFPEAPTMQTFFAPEGFRVCPSPPTDCRSSFVFMFPSVVIFRSPLSIFCLPSEAFGYPGFTRMAEINGIPRSRTFFSKPCSAA